MLGAVPPADKALEAGLECLGGLIRQHFYMHCLEGKAYKDAQVSLQFHWPPDVSHLDPEGTSTVHASMGEGHGRGDSLCWELCHELGGPSWSQLSAGSALGANLPAQLPGP